MVVQSGWKGGVADSYERGNPVRGEAGYWFPSSVFRVPVPGSQVPSSGIGDSSGSGFRFGYTEQSHGAFSGVRRGVGKKLKADAIPENG